MLVGYIRRDRDEQQDSQQQHDVTLTERLDRLYEDVGASRGGLTEMLASLRQGDVVVVTSLSQFGLGLRDFLPLVARLRGSGVHLAALSEGLDTREARSWEFYLSCLRLIAMERQLARQRVDTDYFVVGRARGRKGGRKLKLSPAQVLEAKRMLWVRTNAVRMQDVADHFNISRQTLYARVVNAPDPATIYDYE